MKRTQSVFRARRMAAPKLSLRDALDVVDDNLPDGAWMAMLCELTGLDEGDVAAGLAEIDEEDGA